MLFIPKTSCLADLDENQVPPNSIGDPVAIFLRDLYKDVGGDTPVEYIVDEFRPRYDALTNALGDGSVYDDLMRLFTIRRAELHASIAYQDRLLDALQLLG